MVLQRRSAMSVGIAFLNGSDVRSVEDPGAMMLPTVKTLHEGYRHSICGEAPNLGTISFILLADFEAQKLPMASQLLVKTVLQATASQPLLAKVRNRASLL